MLSHQMIKFCVHSLSTPKTFAPAMVEQPINSLCIASCHILEPFQDYILRRQAAVFVNLFHVKDKDRPDCMVWILAANIIMILSLCNTKVLEEQVVF